MEQTRFRKALLGVALCWLGAAVFPAMAQTTTVAGTMPGQFAINESGAATYRIPIQVPPGIAGMEPKLELAYNSQGGNGLLGMGWSLGGLSTIGRCPRTMAVDGVRGSVNFDMNDRYCLDGQRLVLVSGTYGVAGSEYRTELDSFSRIIASGTAGNGVASFTVQTKAGLTMEYGNTADSRIEAQGKPTVRVWAVSKISDSRNNVLSVSYVEDALNGVFYPNEVNYGNNKVSFSYQERSDIPPVYRGGSVIRNPVRLHSIETKTGSVIVKRYGLAYDNASVTARSRLLAISDCDGTGASCLAPIAITWNPAFSASAWQESASYQLLASISGDGVGDLGVRFEDLNGDGLPDMATGRFTNGVHNRMTWLNNGSSWQESAGYQLPLSITADGLGDQGVRFVDLNGDGLPDFVSSRYTGGADYRTTWLNTGTGWLQSAQYQLPVTISADGVGDLGVRFVDLNGDGLPDLVWGRYTSGVDYRQSWINTGSGWQTSTAYQLPVSISADGVGDLGVRFIDLNGDGLPDLVWGRYTSGANHHQSWINTGSGWQEAPGYQVPVMISADGLADHGVRFVDLNGDGLPDLVWARYTSGVHYRMTWLNTGEGWQLSAGYQLPTTIAGDIEGDLGVRFEDVNGDGLPDLVYGRFSNGVHYRTTWLNTGTGWLESAAYQLPATISADGVGEIGVRFTDLNGDGIPDMVSGRYAGGQHYRVSWLNQTMPDAVVSIKNGAGPALAITQKPLTSAAVYMKDMSPNASVYPKLDLQYPQHVVSAVASGNGIGGTTTTQYNYGGLKAELGTGRGMLGFRWMKSKNLANNIESYTEFNQNWPFTGSVAKSETRLAGSGNAGVLKRTTNSYAQGTGSATGTTFVYPSQSVEESWDLGGAAYPTVTNAYQYGQSPQYGDPTQISVVNSGGAGKTTVNEYWPANTGSGNWILGRLKKATVTSVAP